MTTIGFNVMKKIATKAQRHQNFFYKTFVPLGALVSLWQKGETSDQK